jgi:hypothetical protein
MDIIAYTIPKYPNTLLLELADIVVLIIPKPGIINMYTSGCPKNQKRCWYRIGSPPAAVSKNEVLKFLSVKTIVIAPAKTGKDNSSKTAVTTTAQPNKASLCNLIPGLLILSIVVIKFIAPKRLLIPDKWRANIARSTLGPL